MNTYSRYNTVIDTVFFSTSLFSNVFKARFYLLIILFTFLTSNLYSQKVTATINRNTIRLGEHFDLTLRLEPTSNSPLLIDTWFDAPDSFTNFQVASRGAIDTQTIAATNSYSQVITLTSFDSGTHYLPTFTVVVGGKQLKTQSCPVTVLPIDVSGKTDYNEIKDILEPEPDMGNMLWMVVVISIIAGVSVLGVLCYKQNKKKVTIPITKNYSIEPVLKQLDALQSAYKLNNYQQFYTDLIALCKGFADNCLEIKTVSKTTSEYIFIMKEKIKDKQLLAQYIHLLHLAEKVKFAKATPTDSECKQSIADAKAFITQLHSLHNKPATNAV